MRRLISRFVLATAVLGLVVGAAGRAEAASVTYTETFVGSGSLGGTEFAFALVTLVATADTNNVFSVSNPSFTVYEVNNASTTVTVSGIGTGTFTGNTSTSDTQYDGSSFAGFTDDSVSLIVAVGGSAFSTYDLTSSIGPIGLLPENWSSRNGSLWVE